MIELLKAVVEGKAEVRLMERPLVSLLRRLARRENGAIAVMLMLSSD